ncbi:hypothetical protein POF50_024825 [Streptomyces sp. SL13]|uniref:Uncharacterized protein n=1 Tax=Streptantibioticus silvisoli TaxID=2705255 RepID=A0AA90KI25_9ACTN|nr:hypothetical protein [Streptantibioticus silvisoli]MDI5972525.1 hypothetical protein [Streptantibioticus silvisoli]
MTEQFLESGPRDPARWIALPTDWPAPGFEKDFPDPATWAVIAANAVWNDSPLTPRGDEVDSLAQVLAYCADNCPRPLPGYEIYLHLPGPRDVPLPVYVGDYPRTTDPESDLRYALAVEDPEAVEPPLVEEFTAAGLGSGLRALRYCRDRDDAYGGILVGLRYAWYVEHLDLIVSVRTVHPHPGRVIAAIDDIDALCRGLRYVAEDEPRS